jgi:two-component system sensor histidine kinase RegB
MNINYLDASGKSSDTIELGRFQVYSLRWLSILFMVILTVLGSSVLNIKLPTLSLLVVAAVTLVYNLIVFSFRKTGGLWGRYSVAVELGIDIVAWSVYTGLSGGATNPLISILLPLVAIGAAVLPIGQAWALGLFSIGAYSLLWQIFLPLVIYDRGLAVHLHLLGMWLTFVVSVAVAVWFIGSMTSAVRERDQNLARAREEALRNEWVVTLGSLAAGAAHEMSTPLATLGMLVEELFARPDIPQDLRPDVTLMRKQIEACKRSLTQLSARAGNERAIQIETCPVEEWMRHLVQQWQTLYPATDIDLSIAPGIDTVRIVPDLPLEQALRNLVDNAVNAEPTNIAIELRRDGDDLVLRIIDQGKGIPARVVNHLGKVPPLPSREGLGIGLTLSKGAIERYAGRVSFSLRPEGGTDTLIRLPLSRISTG